MDYADVDDLRVEPGDTPEVIRAKGEMRERIIRAAPKPNAIAQIIDSIGGNGFGLLLVGSVIVSVIVALTA